MDGDDEDGEYIDNDKEEDEEEDVEEVDEEEEDNNEGDDDDEYQTLAPAPEPTKRKSSGKAKGKGKMVILGSQDWDVPPTTQEEKRRASPRSNGVVKTPACVRCVKGSRTCYEQSGLGKACWYCAWIKMRCNPVNNDDDDWRKAIKICVIKLTSMQPVPSKEPQTKKRRASAASRPVPVEKKPPVPAPPPSRSQQAPLLARSRPAPAPAPIQPAPDQKIKVLKAPPLKLSSVVPGTIRQPIEKTFKEMETSDSKSEMFLLNDIYKHDL